MPLPCQVRRTRGMPFLRHFVGIGLLLSLAFCNGCSHCAKRAQWHHNGECKYAQVIHAAAVHPDADFSLGDPLVAGPTAAELAAEAAAHEEAGDPACVDLYFAATLQSWQYVAALGEYPGHFELLCRTKTYDACLAKLLATAQRFHRLDPLTGLRVFYNHQPLTIPVQLHGFAWSVEDSQPARIGRRLSAWQGGKVRYEPKGSAFRWSSCADETARKNSFERTSPSPRRPFCARAARSCPQRLPLAPASLPVNPLLVNR